MLAIVRIGFGICLFFYPILVLSIQGGMNALFFLAFILSVISLIKQRYPLGFYFDFHAKILAIAMCSSIVAALLSEFGHHSYAPPVFDAPSRLLLAIFIFLALRSIDLRTFAPLQYGFPVGAITSFIFVIVSSKSRVSASFIDTIHFGNLSMLLGLLSALSIRWTHKDAPWLITLKLFGLLAGTYVSIQSGERGGWIAIPFIFLTWIVLQNFQNKVRWLLFSTILLLLSIALSYLFIPIVHLRIDQTYQELFDFLHGQNLASPTGVRLQQWQAAWQIFLQNPVFGVGANNIGSAMIPFEQTGFISKRAAMLAYGELHSDIFSYMTRFGILGLLSILSIYFVPLALFLRAAKSGHNFQRTAGKMGACFIVAFFVFGLTVENFNIKMVIAFYAMTLAVLMAAALSTRIGSTSLKPEN